MPSRGPDDVEANVAGARSLSIESALRDMASGIPCACPNSEDSSRGRLLQVPSVPRMALDIAAARTRPNVVAFDSGEPPELRAVLSDYLAHLERAPFSPNTRRSYGLQARRFFDWRAGKGSAAADALTIAGRDYALRDYRSDLIDRHLAPASINSALAGLDDLYRFLRLDPPRVRREPLPASAPRALEDEELRRLLRAAEAGGESRDRAVVGLMALAGLRLAEVAGLDVDDVTVSARRGMVAVRHGKGDVGRTVRIGAAAGPSVSPHVLRHTFVTRLIRSGKDVVLVAELAGHRSFETTRRYALPTEADRAAAVGAAAVEY